MSSLFIKLFILSIAFCANSFAQKEYIDPSVKQKRPLLDSAIEGVTKNTEAAVPSTAAQFSKKQQYCACVNSTLLTEQAHTLWTNMYRDEHITNDDYFRKRYSEEAKEKKALSKAFAVKHDLDSDDIDCEIIRVRTQKIRELVKAIEAQDDLCSFEEIKRKRY